MVGDSHRNSRNKGIIIVPAVSGQSTFSLDHLRQRCMSHSSEWRDLSYFGNAKETRKDQENDHAQSQGHHQNPEMSYDTGSLLNFPGRI